MLFRSPVAPPDVVPEDIDAGGSSGEVMSEEYFGAVTVIVPRLLDGKFPIGKDVEVMSAEYFGAETVIVPKFASPEEMVAFPVVDESTVAVDVVSVG